MSGVLSIYFVQFCLVCRRTGYISSLDVYDFIHNDCCARAMDLYTTAFWIPNILSDLEVGINSYHAQKKQEPRMRVSNQIILTKDAITFLKQIE